MKKLLPAILVFSMVLSFVFPASTAFASMPPELILTGVTVSAKVDKISGNQNVLWITITDSSGTYTKSYAIHNNEGWVYQISTGNGVYEVYVLTKGNVQIRACYLVSFTANTGGTGTANYSALYAAINETRLLNQNIYTTESWAILAAAVTNGEAVELNLPASSQSTIDSLTNAITNALNNLAWKDINNPNPVRFISFTASVTIVSTFVETPVTFYAKVVDTYKPKDGKIYVFRGNNLLLELYDNGCGADLHAGDNIYSGTTTITVLSSGIYEFHAESNNSNSQSIYIWSN